MKPWTPTKCVPKRIYVNIHSPISSRPASLPGPFLLFFNSKPSRRNSLEVPMDNGQNGLIRLSKSCIISLKSSERLKARYVSEYAFLLRSPPSFMWQVLLSSNLIFAGIGELLSVCILISFAWAVVIHGSLRQLKKFDQAKTLLSTSLSGLKSFSNVSRSTQQCRRPSLQK